MKYIQALCAVSMALAVAVLYTFFPIAACDALGMSPICVAAWLLFLPAMLMAIGIIRFAYLLAVGKETL